MPLTTAEAIVQTLESDCVTGIDSPETPNVVDAIGSLCLAVRKVATSIIPPTAVPGHDAAGGCVDSLTEAVMGMTAGLCRIAESISDLASAVRERGE